MLYNYIAIVVLVVFAILVPLEYLMFSALIRAKSRPNAVKQKPYESAEESTDGVHDIESEYFSFFVLFLPFEFIIVLLLLWAPLAKIMALSDNVLMLGLPILAMLFSAIIYKIIIKK
ncbi:MAG: NADH-quinone oxidoreductase subunit A [Candidatus Marsarchaeota archaeon]|jgi:NADH:ubiquinone oxidoreductase subunit 3 (subunit A)|nr:NADH-quinone oxidoreductase subunit A [Candidatus Marsarchaeota archaeon]